jgi:peptidoglycan-associated lipoprotein
MTANNRCLAAALSTLLVVLGCASTSSTSTPDAIAPDPALADAKDPGAVTLHQQAVSSLEPIYFDTDRSLLQPEARAALKRHAQAILSHPEWGVLRIEGHCDERGSDEYNLALGGRRAAVVERYLLHLGVPAERLATRTLGEEKPAVAGHGEEAWRYNRRSEITSPTFESASR